MSRSERMADERLADWVDGRMAPAELARFEAELRADPDLASAAEEYRRTVAQIRATLLTDPARERPPVNFADAVLAAVAAEPAPPVPNVRRLRLLPFLASAAAAAAVFMVYLVVQQRGDEPNTPGEETARLEKTVRGFGQDLAPDLEADGSRSWAAAGGKDDESLVAGAARPPEAKKQEEPAANVRTLAVDDDRKPAPGARAPVPEPADKPAAADSEAGPLPTGAPRNPPVEFARKSDVEDAKDGRAGSVLAETDPVAQEATAMVLLVVAHEPLAVEQLARIDDMSDRERRQARGDEGAKGKDDRREAGQREAGQREAHKEAPAGRARAMDQQAAKLVRPFEPGPGVVEVPLAKNEGLLDAGEVGATRYQAQTGAGVRDEVAPALRLQHGDRLFWIEGDAAQRARVVERVRQLAQSSLARVETRVAQLPVAVRARVPAEADDEEKKRAAETRSALGAAKRERDVPVWLLVRPGPGEPKGK